MRSLAKCLCTVRTYLSQSATVCIGCLVANSSLVSAGHPTQTAWLYGSWHVQKEAAQIEVSSFLLQMLPLLLLVVPHTGDGEHTAAHLFV